MTRFKIYFSIGLLTCLVLEPLLAQSRSSSRSGSSSSGSSSGASQRREGPSSSSSASSRSSSSSSRQQVQPRQVQPRQSQPRQTSPSTSQRQVEPRRQTPQQPTNNNSGSVRRERQTQTQNPTTTTRNSGNSNNRNNQQEVNPRQSNNNGNSSTSNNTNRRSSQTREQATTPTIRRDVNPSTVERTRRTVDRRADYGTSRYHRPYGHNHRQVRTVQRHVIHHHNYRHHIYFTPNLYYTHLYTHANMCYYSNWIYCYTSRPNGFYIIDGYPYYVYNNNYHRYSSFDSCNYQLIDTFYGIPQESYWGVTCKNALDKCLSEMDYRNFTVNANQYSCAETHRPSNFDFNYYYDDNVYLAPEAQQPNQTPVQQQVEQQIDDLNTIESVEIEEAPQDVSPALDKVLVSSVEVTTTNPVIPRTSRERDTQDY